MTAFLILSNKSDTTVPPNKASGQNWLMLHTSEEIRAIQQY